MAAPSAALRRVIQRGNDVGVIAERRGLIVAGCRKTDVDRGRRRHVRDAQLRGRFADVDLDELIDVRLVRAWLYWGLFWLMFAPTVGVTISTLFNYPEYLGDVRRVCTFGRLRPIHVNGVICGAFSTLFIGALLLHRPAPVRRAGWPSAGATRWLWVWNLNLAGRAHLACRSATTAAGRRASCRCSTGDPVFIARGAATVQFLMTIARRRSRRSTSRSGT